MFNLIKNCLGLTIVGGLRKYISLYKNSYSIFDSTVVNCTVSGASYSCYCYCNDGLRVPACSNSLTIFASKKYSSRQEAEAALDLDILNASKIFPETKFYRQKYYPEHDAVGAILCCINQCWTAEENTTHVICPGCLKKYDELPVNSICEECGEPLGF